MCIESIQKTYAMIIGAVLILVGLIGFFNNPIFGLFGVNPAQNVLHLVGGALGVWLGMRTVNAAKAYNMWLGIVAAVVAVVGFIPAGLDLLNNILNINLEITVLHAAIAVVSLGVVYGVKR